MRIIAGEWGGRRIRAPVGRDVRPTSDRVREAWMSALAPRISDARVLDLFAGSGALGLEALSRGAQHVVFVERGRKPLAVLEENVEALGAGERCTIFRGDVYRFLESQVGEPFELALADPPYADGHALRLFERMARDPFAQEVWVEHRSGEELPSLPCLRSRRYGDTTLTFWEPAG